MMRVNMKHDSNWISRCGETGATHRGWRLRRIEMIALGIALLCISACASGSAPPRGVRSTASPIPTMPALPAVTPDASVASACAGAGGSALGTGLIQVGAFDSWQALPSDLPLKPEPSSAVKITGNIALNAVTVDIGLKTPSSGAPGYICAVTARIVAYQPLAAPIPNVTRTCADHVYLDPGGPDYGGDCGGVLAGPPATANIAFAASAPGTTISVPIKSDVTAGKPAAFPSPDGRSSHAWIGLRVPASGIYTFVIGLWQDASGPALRVAVQDTFNLDATHEWSGLACALPSMQAQLPPPTNPPTSLLCPGGPPGLLQ